MIEKIAERVGLKFGDRAVEIQALVVAEEAGEAIKEIRRYIGAARSGSNRQLVTGELADVIISTEVLAALMSIDLDKAVGDKLHEIEARGGL